MDRASTTQSAKDIIVLDGFVGGENARYMETQTDEKPRESSAQSKGCSSMYVDDSRAVLCTEENISSLLHGCICPLTRVCCFLLPTLLSDGRCFEKEWLLSLGGAVGKSNTIYHSSNNAPYTEKLWWHGCHVAHLKKAVEPHS